VTRWYRAYEGTVTDPKLAEAALIAECSRAVAIAAWHCILENCAGFNDGGRHDVTPRRLSAILAEPLAVTTAVLVAFAEVGLVKDGNVPAWKSRQFESDLSTERSRRHRERKRNGDATLHHVAATPPETETEEETERKKEPTSNEVGRAEPVEALAEQIAIDCSSPNAAAAAARQQLWSEGLPALVAMGVSEKQARPIIGRWLKDAADDALRVLGAIQRAREHAPMDPIPWINAGFQKIKSKRETSNDRTTALSDALGPNLYGLAEQFSGGGPDSPGGGHRLALPGPR